MTCKQCKNLYECESDAFFNEAKFDPDASADCCAGFEPMTRADRIRAMSDEELAGLLYQYAHSNYKPLNKDVLAKWLQQPAEEGADNE